ncbi:capsular polysaccharide biosynthesis protein [Tranquillimonas rosea]|uniref:capsular polysaccharide biosynthesis protein n=1 Tax=Tranquillimonas rosea TaxID=641238 RepID=UPI003BA96B16
MTADGSEIAAATRLHVFSGGFLTQRRVRRILQLAGWTPTLGRPGPDDTVGVWGHSSAARRGRTVAERTGARILTVEDTFLRSVHPGRVANEPPLGLTLDTRGAFFDARQPSDLEHLLATHPLDDTALLDRARGGIARMRQRHLSKYTGFDPALPVPAPGYALVIDQTRGDASVTLGGGGQAMFDEMLAVAQIENPGARILIRTHPETRAGRRPGHYGPMHEDARTTLHGDAVSPWALLEGAVAVYTVSSQLGFEAILAGHCPRVFGQPFYGGWGLTQDEAPLPRRTRRLTRAQLFAATMLLYPVWYDPCLNRLCAFETALNQLDAATRAWREDRYGYVASGMRLWKRPALRGMFGGHGPMRFADPPATASRRAARAGRPLMVWASRDGDDHAAPSVVRVEDGFLRSRGLGADLVPPLSLVADRQGIYYDPTRWSDLEDLIAESVTLPETELRRAERLIARLVTADLSKYNLAGTDLPCLPAGRRILVPGQVEDDASIRLGCGEIRTNAALLARCRRDAPDAVLLYKPHPDVEAGLRSGALPAAKADAVLRTVSPTAAIGAADEVWTMTSLLGFEAMLRGKPVTCLGTPFYAGWGLTRDLDAVPARRTARPSLAQLVHATLIGYPRYRDPLTGLPCPVEVVVDRLAEGTALPGAPALRVLSKLQGLFASQSRLWR